MLNLIISETIYIFQKKNIIFEYKITIFSYFVCSITTT